MLIEIKNDVYFILERLREIDSGYKIFYSTKKKKFEIHNLKQIGNSYCLTVPYKVLDARTVALIRKTRVENAADLIKEMDKNNAKLEQSRKNKMLDDAKANLKESLKNYKFI